MAKLRYTLARTTSDFSVDSEQDFQCCDEMPLEAPLRVLYRHAGLAAFRSQTNINVRPKSRHAILIDPLHTSRQPASLCVVNIQIQYCATCPRSSCCAMDQHVSQYDITFDQRVTIGPYMQHQRRQLHQHDMYRFVRILYATTSFSTH